MFRNYLFSLIGTTLLITTGIGQLVVTGLALAAPPNPNVVHSAPIAEVRIAETSIGLHEAYWGEQDTPIVIEAKASQPGTTLLTGLGIQLTAPIVDSAKVSDNTGVILKTIDATGLKGLRFDFSNMPVSLSENSWRKLHVYLTYIDNPSGMYPDDFHLRAVLWPTAFQGLYQYPYLTDRWWLPLLFFFQPVPDELIFEAILTEAPPQYQPTALVTTLDTPISRNIVVGRTDFDWTYTEILNETAEWEDIRVTNITIEDTLGDARDDFNALDNAELWADLDGNGSYETKVSNTEQCQDTGVLIETHIFMLATPLIVDTSVRIAFRSDLGVSTPAGDTHTIRVSQISAIGNDTASEVLATYRGTGQTMTVVASGSLVSSVDGDSPASAIVIGGISSHTALAKFKFLAFDESQLVTKLTFTMDEVTLSGSAGYTSMDNLKIIFPTKTGTASREASVGSARTTFDNLDMYVPEDSSAVVTVLGKAKKVGEEWGGTFRDTLTVGLDTTGNDTAYFSSVGEISGTELDGSDVLDQFGHAMVLYNTRVTVTNNNPGGPGIIQPGATVDLYKFKVTADTAGDVAIKKFTFRIFISDSSTTNPSSADLGGFTFLRDGTDITNSAQITQISNDDGVTYLNSPLNVKTKGINDLENNSWYWVQVAFNNTPANGGEQVISAGVTRAYTLRAECGTGFAVMDFFGTTLLGDTTIPTIEANYLSDADADFGGVQQVITLQKGEGVQDNTDLEFVWSDYSFLPHLSTFDDDGIIETSSADWTNGYLVKNFPLSDYIYTL
ncbi:hypothetical protein A2810_02415 [candidate division Kazan bacterium RIFCSPHIGHO2_01_FULL_49_10]|uniref:Uncharacterized protein n=1 Tax=candidate division Kazan bacterium RIFCSPLOWO2_01_FULL_48_13 TaxID=1798539 RepID=A0A1F4PPL2_UNCK3|nr:MAG: hypothetical protein A2810_02415 [candidate division Kazan bacterium RIFCSPHIGHO2_01_FULL_49_10]OGB85598.1 MAG: hypothetical protein A2994_01085 [candidate division Kazan bacterium RIFCSPLOWO2_01_FULL_48_13]